LARQDEWDVAALGLVLDPLRRQLRPLPMILAAVGL
jgi:hypothetical protein